MKHTHTYFHVKAVLLSLEMWDNVSNFPCMWKTNFLGICIVSGCLLSCNASHAPLSRVCQLIIRNFVSVPVWCCCYRNRNEKEVDNELNSSKLVDRTSSKYRSMISELITGLTLHSSKRGNANVGDQITVNNQIQLDFQWIHAQ